MPIPSSSRRLLAASVLLLAVMTAIHNPAATAMGPSQINVSFPAMDGLLQLEGTLRLPDSSLWPVPGVVLMHGSGEKLSRDQVVPGQNALVFGFDLVMFAEIGDALQKEGNAVLTYDKRTCGKFNNGCWNDYPEPLWDNITVHTFLNDGLAAANYLQGREEIDRVVVVGHSQSSQFVHTILQTNPTSFQAGVMLGGGFHPVDTLIEYQLEVHLDILQRAGYNEADALESMSGLVQAVNGLQAIRAGTSDEPVLNASAAFWRDWFAFHDESLLVVANTTNQPTLTIHGGMDWNVPVSEADAWEEFFHTRVEARLEQKVFPCVTHVLNCVSEPDPLKITTADIGTKVDPQVTNALIQFVKDPYGDNHNNDSSGARRSWTALWTIVASSTLVTLLL